MRTCNGHPYLMAAVAIFISVLCSGRSAAVAAIENGQFSFVANASTAPLQSEFDYIIVGGGTAGCPLAATLSQNFKVLLLERGGAPYHYPSVQSAINFAQVLSDIGDDKVSPSQAFQSEDHVYNRRARILGGGTAVNAGFYSRALSDWIDDRNLNVARVQASYAWVESVVASFPQIGPWQTAVRDALLEVGVTPDNGLTYDHLPGTKVGGTIFDTVGHRRTSADLLQYANAANIQVFVYATAQQIVFRSDNATSVLLTLRRSHDQRIVLTTAWQPYSVPLSYPILKATIQRTVKTFVDKMGDAEASVAIDNYIKRVNASGAQLPGACHLVNITKAVPRATGIIYSDEYGIMHQAVLNSRAGSEVILSSGAMGSPHLLMLSGIGPRQHLMEFGIPVILDQPAVGQNMTDNPSVTMLIPSREPLEESLIATAGILSSTGFYIEGSSGASTSFGELRSLNTLPPKYRTQELLTNFSRMLLAFPPEATAVIAQAGVLVGKLAAPVSRGSLKLNSTDILHNPKVQFNYLSDPLDLYTCVEGVRVMQQVVKSRALGSIVYPKLPNSALTWAGFVAPLAPETDDAGLLSQWCRDTVRSIWHFHGGCQEGVVVDQAYKVSGVDALRIVDGSTFSSSPGTNPQATLLMLGRYVGMEILDERKQMKV